MSRFTGTTERVPRVSHEQWRSVAAHYSDLTDLIAGRDDIVVRIDTTVADGAAQACWIPALAQIELGIDLFDGTSPERINPSRISHRNLVPVAYGAFIHECGHAAHTHWAPANGDNPDHVNAAFLLEESRMERQVLADNPSHRRWLRACIRTVVAGSFTSLDQSPAAAGAAAALLLARVDAGVLDDTDTEQIETAVNNILGRDVTAKLRDLWLEAQALDDTDGPGMIDVGRRWNEILNQGTNSQNDSGNNSTSDSASDDDSDATNSPSDSTDGGLADAVNAALDEIAESEADDIRSETETSTQTDSTSDDRAEQDRQAEVAFGSGGAVRQRFTVSERPPTAKETAATNVLATELRKARFRDRERSSVPSVVPPGRLRTRAAMQRSAAVSQGRVSDAQPWRQVRRTQVDEATLTVGIAVDVSSSMGPAQEPVGSAAWVLGNAISRVEGRFATVAFGAGTKGIVAPDTTPKNVSVVSATHSNHLIGPALQALDGALSLSNSTGPRLLVVVSDGRHTATEVRSAQTQIDTLMASGCAVVWLSFDQEQTRYRVTSNQVITPDLLAVASAIGRTAVEAPKRA